MRFFERMECVTFLMSDFITGGDCLDGCEPSAGH